MRRMHGYGFVLLCGSSLLTWSTFWIDPTAVFSEVIYILTTLFFMAGAYLCACRQVLKHGASLRAILFWAILARIVLLPSMPVYETDYFRYLWDGFVVTQGVNPYQYSPNQVLSAVGNLEKIDTGSKIVLLCNELNEKPEMLEVLRNVNNADLNTIYPPFTQILFAASAFLAPGSLIAWRSIVLCFDIGLIALIIILLRSFHFDASRVVFYAWSPLILKEYVNTTHFDVIALCGLFTVFALMQKRRFHGAAAALACAAQSKIFPLFVFPLFVKRWRWANWVTFIVTLFFLSLIFIRVGESGMKGWSAFLQRWEANSSVVALLEWLLMKCGVPAWGEGIPLFAYSGSTYQLDAFLIAKLLAASIWLTGLAVITMRGLKRQEQSVETIIRDAFFIIGLLLICSPVCNPWYLAWVVPFLCFCPSVAWVYLTLSCLLYYTFFIPAPSEQFLWVRILEYLPFYALLIWEWKKK